MRTLQVFDRYLAPSMNWAFHLIRNLPHERVYVSAPVIEELEFTDPILHFLRFPHQALYQKKISADSGFKGLALKALLSAALHSENFSRFLIDHIKNHQIDLLHAHFGTVGTRVRQVARETGIPLVVSFYGFDIHHVPKSRPRFKALYRKLFSEATAIIVEGPAAGKSLEMIHCPPEKIRICPLGIDTGKVKIKPQEIQSKRTVKLIQVANFTEKKGQDLSIEAISKLRSSFPELQLDLYGKDDTSYGKLCKEKAHELEVGDAVKFMGPLSYGQLHETLAKYDLFIHPSRFAENGDCEGGAPVVLLDAQATGLPVISTYHCDIPQVVQHEKTGFLVEEEDSDQLAKHIEKYILMSSDKQKEMSKAARNFVLSNYKAIQSAARLHEIYLKSLS